MDDADEAKRAYSYCRGLESGHSRLTVPSPTTYRAKDEVTVFIYADDPVEAFTSLAVVLTPDIEPALDIAQEWSTPKITYDTSTGCWSATLTVPESTTGITWTLKERDAFVTMNITRNREGCVFVHYARPSTHNDKCTEAYRAWLLGFWTKHVADPAALSVHHGQLLCAYHSVPSAVVVFATLDDVYKRFVRPVQDRQKKELLVLSLLAHVGQVLDIDKKLAGDFLQPDDGTEAGVTEFLWSLGMHEFSPSTVTTWCSQLENHTAAYFVRKVAQWLYEFDRRAFVSSFRFVSVTDLLLSLNVPGAPKHVESVLGLPLVKHQLRKTDLPDFKATGVVPAATGVAQAANVAWGDLEQSETLAEREVLWDKAVKSAQSTLQRLHTSRVILRNERAWIDKQVSEATLAKRVAFHSEWHLLKDGMQSAQVILQSIDDNLGQLEGLGLAKNALTLAQKGQRLRQVTHDLVDSYGKYVGSSDNESYGITTFAGFERNPTQTASPDGMRDQSGVLPVGCVVVRAAGAPGAQRGLGDNQNFHTYFLESGGRFRYATANLIMTLPLLDPEPVMVEGVEVHTSNVHNTMRAPCAIVAMAEQDFLVADSGRCVIRRIYNKAGRGWVIDTAFGEVGERGYIDGENKKCRFHMIRNMKTVDRKKGGPVIAVCDGGRLRLLLGGSASGRVITLLSELGPAAAQTADVRDVAYDRDNDILYYIDRHAVRCIERFSDVKGLQAKSRVVSGFTAHSGKPTQTPAFFHAPQGLAFTRVPRKVPLPEKVEKKPVNKDKEKEKENKKTDKLDPQELEKLRLKELHEKTVPVLLVCDTGNNVIRAIRCEGWSYAFDKVSVKTVLGRETGKGSSKDGIADASILTAPTRITERPDGDFMIIEPGRMRIVAPPHILSKAANQYTHLGREVEMLSDSLVDAAKASNVHSSFVVECVRRARMTLLDGRQKVEANSFRDYAGVVIAERPDLLVPLLAAAPSVDMIAWLARTAVDIGLIEDTAGLPREATASSEYMDLPHSVSRTKSYTHLDALEEAVSRLTWPPSVKDQVAMLEELTSLASDHQGLLTHVAAENVLTGRDFRVPPCAALMRFLLATCGSLHMDVVSDEMRAAVQAWLTDAIPRGSKSEKTTHKSYTRGAVKLWGEYFTEDKKAKKPSDAAAIHEMALSLATITFHGALTSDDHTASVLCWIGRGVSNLLYGEPDADEIDVLTYEVPTLPTIVVDMLISVIGKASASLHEVDIFTHLTAPSFDTKTKYDHDEDDDDDANDAPISVQDAHMIFCLLDNTLRSLRCVALDDSMTLEMLLAGTNGKLWSQVLPWYVKKSKDMHAVGAGFARLSEVCKAAGKVFREGCQRLKDETVEIDAVKSIIAGKAELVGCFAAVGAKDAEGIVLRCEETYNTLVTLAAHCEDAALVFLPEHPFSHYLLQLADARSQLSMAQCAAIYNLERDVHAPIPEGLFALPERYVKASGWLDVMRSNAIFHIAWNKATPEEAPATVWCGSTGVIDAHIDSAVEEFLEIGRRFRELETTFNELQEISACLSPERLEELPGSASSGSTMHHFCRAIRELTGRTDPNHFPLPTNRIEAYFYSRLVHILGSFSLLKQLRDDKEMLEERIALIGHFVRPTGRLTVTSALTSLGMICKTVSEMDWSALTIKSFDEIDKFLQGVDESILTTNTALLQALKAHPNFLEFLGEQDSDNNFTSSIEMSMGRPEMECPPELWVSEADGPGHPDEMVLSKLTGVRATLHKFLYQAGGTKRGALKEVTHALCHITPAAASATICAIEELSTLELALGDLLSGGGDASALSRLANLYSPSWESEWVLTGTHTTGEVTLCLQYKATRGDKVIVSRQKVDELLDFQSAVVLSKGTAEVTALVQSFVAQFGWARELAKECQKLRSAWHPAKQSFVTSIPLSTPPDAVHIMVEEARTELAHWAKEVVAVRRRFPLLNTITLGQLLRLMRTFETGSATQEEISTITEEVARSMFPAAPPADARELLEGVWGEQTEITSTSFLAKVDEMMNVVPREWQEFTARPIANNAVAVEGMPKGVQVVVVEREERMKTLLSAHLRASILPEWHQVVCVTASTTMELISNLILTWAHKESSDGTPQLYSLIGVEQMDDTLHHAVVSMLVELEPVAKNALFVVSGERDHYVVRQLAPWRVATSVLPDDELQRVGFALAGSAESVAVYHSATAGAGKSFAIRRQAGARRTVHVPMQRNLSPSELIKKVESCIAGVDDAEGSSAAGYVLHLDLSESITEESSVLLFELLVTGSVYNDVEGRRWFVDHNASICVEAAPGTIELPVLSCLMRHTSVAAKETFAVDEETLRVGMGRQFTSRKRDGNTFNTALPLALPHERLAWVVRGIKLVDSSVLLTAQALQAAVPADYTKGEDCFGILCRVANLQEPVSLWSLWSFVDIAYWLLHSAFCDISQLEKNLLSGVAGTTEDQCRLRAEAFDFICRTSTDFATRQKRGESDDLMWLRTTQRCFYSDKSVSGVHTHFYRRAHFRSYGQPVFRMGSFFDPTFIHFKQDRWVMSDVIHSTVVPSSQGPVNAGLLEPWVSENDTIEIEVMTNAQMERANTQLYNRTQTEEGIIQPKEGPLGDLKTWNEANHEALLVSAATGGLEVLALNHVALKKRMHPQLLQFLERSNVSVGATDLKSHEVLSILTNVTRDERAAAKLLGGTYCMTRDVLLKILAVFIRVRCGVPVILMGECGCGKTHMLRYMCAWLDAKLLILDVHGGTTEKDILRTFIKAREELASPEVREVYVFLDEVNTCTHMGLISEIIVDHTIFGKPIKQGIHVLAACNPYRKRAGSALSAGLAYAAPNRDDLFVDELRDLVYRVHPIPHRIQEFIFDFGSLADSVEESYIQAMVAAHIDDATMHSFITKLLVKAQQFIREVEGDPSVVSLRDLKRTLRLAKWFAKYGTKSTAGRNKWAAPVVLGIAHVFYFRLPDSAQRAALMETLRTANTRTRAEDVGVGWLVEKGYMEKLVRQTMNAICGKLVVDEGISLNQALKENLYVTMISIFNRIPVFVVGKPGSSKTLTLQVLASNLKGDQSSSPFWAKFPALYIFPYQCSPLSTAAGIKHQFDIACNYQKKATKTMVVLLLDEVGLAEHSPDMPLKVLHGILVDPPISIVGLSNWTLDAAKMNRAICLQRPEPAKDDIYMTGQHLVGTSSQLHSSNMLSSLSSAYHIVYTTQTGRDFIGMRDFYQALKLLKRELLYLIPAECVCEGMQCLVVDTDLRAQLSKLITDETAAQILTIGDIATFVYEEAKPATPTQDDPTEPTETPKSSEPIKRILAEENHVVSFVEGLPAMTRAELEELFKAEKILPFRKLTGTQVQLYAEDSKNISPIDVTSAVAEVTSRREKSNAGVSRAMLSYVLLRNFGGNEEVVDTVCNVVGKECYNDFDALRTHRLPPLRLIASNLSDPESRHLMLLTENGAALPLIFDSGLLNPDNTEILVGSTFKDDSHELHLIQQVNKVKAAMAKGKVVVLHNHDSIYESLYDVLNQRYVTGTQLASGKEKKMLRLAIGSRSQLCPVEEGFRIVVVAEQKHADENLDLPLLNRFEKQSLNFRDCLNAEQLELCKLIEAWVEIILQESAFPDLTHVFSGFNDQTIPSLVFSCPGLSEDQLHAKLAHTATPVAMIHSPALCLALPSYEEDHAGIEWLLQHLEGDGNTQRLVSVTTHSPVEQATIRLLSETPSNGREWSVVRLAEIGSEDTLKGVAADFIDAAGSGDTRKVLLVQCDPMSSSQNTIEHAKRVVQRAFVDAPGNALVVFMIHLPPGAKNCARVFHVNFYTGWETFFLDDVAVRDRETEELLRGSLSELVETGVIDIMALVMQKLQTTLSLIHQPAGLKSTFQERMNHVTFLLSDEKFANVVKKLFLQVLRERCGVTASGLQLHVELALGNLAAGSLRVSLRYVLEAVTIKVAAHILSKLDTNGNLLSYTPESQELWLKMQEHFHKQDDLASDFVIDGVTRFEESLNTGILHPLVCKFPFSNRLLKVNDTAKAVMQAEAQQGHIDYERLAKACETLVGVDMVRLWDAQFAQSHEAYLHDFVHSKASHFPGLSVTRTIALYQHVLTRTDPEVLRSPLSIHVSYWANEERLFFLMSLMSAVDEAAQDDMLAAIARATSPQSIGQAAVDICLEACVARLRGAGDNTATWAAFVYRTLPGVVLDTKSLVAEVDAPCMTALSSLGLVAAFFREFSKTKVKMATFFMPLMAVQAPFRVQQLTDLFATHDAPQEDKDMFLVAFVRGFVTHTDGVPLPVAALNRAELCDLLRVSCGLRPKLWPGTAPCSETVRRGILHCLVEVMGTEALCKLAEAEVKMGETYTQRLTNMISGYLEDTTPEYVTDTYADISDADVALVTQTPEVKYRYDYLVAVVKVKKIMTWVAHETQRIIEEHRHADNKAEFPSHAPKMSVRVRSLLKTYPQAGHHISKIMANEGGPQQLLDFLQAGRGLNSYVSFDRPLLESCRHEELLPDLAPVLADSLAVYKQLVDMVTGALKGGAPAKKCASDMIVDMGVSTVTKLCTLFSVRALAERANNFSGKEILQEWLDSATFAHYKMPRAFLTVFGWGPQAKEAGNVSGRRFSYRYPPSFSLNRKQIIHSLSFQVSLMLPSMPKSFLYTAAMAPTRLKSVCIPSLPLGGDDMRYVMQGMNEYVTWYKCPKGHLYSIGECGGAMEVSKCAHPGCGAEVGGRNHTSLKGNTLVGSSADVLKASGGDSGKSGGFFYNAPFAVHRASHQLNQRTSLVLRLLLYIAFHMNLLEASPTLHQLDAKLTSAHIHDHTATIINTLTRVYHLKDSDLLLLLCDIFRRLTPLLQGSGKMNSSEEVTAFEEAAESVIGSCFNNVRGTIAEMQTKTAMTSSLSTLKKAVPEAYFAAMLAGSGAPVVEHIWQPRPVVSMQHFKAYFASSSSNAVRHPLLHAVCGNETRLNIVKHLADILELQAVLFECLEGRHLSRDEVSQMPTSQVVSEIADAAKRSRAEKALAGYCKVFNEAMPLLPNLYECQRNPFLNEQDEVDLSNGMAAQRTLLTPDAPLTFCLPSMVPGDIDAPGVCTIQIAGLLSRVHNTTIQHLRSLQEDASEPQFPLNIGVLTPPEVVRRALVTYDRERDFLPLLYRYKVETDGMLGYDVHAIERSLAQSVLRGKVPVQLQMAHHQYKGEVRQRGFLATLSNMDQASVLPPAIEAALGAELTTKQELTRMLRVVEEIVNFFAAVGATVAHDTRLAVFCEDFMGMREWDGETLSHLLTPAVYDDGKVSHLKALFLFVEGLLEGGATARVKAAYCKPLEEDLQMELRRAAGSMKHAHLVSALRDLLVGPLSEGSNFPGSESLKDYIGYQDMDVGNSDWFEEFFPESLQLLHAKQTFDLLTKIAQKS